MDGGEDNDQRRVPLTWDSSGQLVRRGQVTSESLSPGPVDERVLVADKSFHLRKWREMVLYLGGLALLFVVVTLVVTVSAALWLAIPGAGLIWFARHYLWEKLN